MTPNSKPTKKSEPSLSGRPINSPEFLREAFGEIREMAEKGEIKLEGFEFLPETPRK